LDGPFLARATCMFAGRSTKMGGRWLQALPRFDRELGRQGLVLMVLGIHAGLLAWIAAQWSPVMDEPIHLAAGIRFWQTGHSNLDRGNTPLFRAVAALPVLMAKPAVDWRNVPNTHGCSRDFLVANGPRSFWLITLGRWACIPFSILGGYFCYRWARQWYGDAAGMTALVLWCFSPNIIAHGHLITGDMAATSLGVAACFTFWRWLDAPSWSKAAWAGVFWGLAELSKFVWFVLYPLWPVMWVMWRWLHRREPGRPSWFREAAQLLVMGLLSVWVINLGYGFEGSLDRFRRHVGADEPTAGRIEGPPVAQTGLTAWIKFLPLPLPKDYVGGIGEVQYRSDQDIQRHLRGEVRPGGRWHFYLHGILLKEPVATLLLVALATVLAVASAKYRTDWRREAFLLLCGSAVLCSVSLVTVQQFRYALPVFPLLFIWASRTGRAWENQQPALGVLAAGCLLWTVVSSLAVYPHSLSYFNEWAGGPRDGHWYLPESNADWGQDVLYLKKWYDAHPQARPFHLAYFGKIDPRLAGIEFSLPPQDGPRPGWHALSVQLLKYRDREAPDGKGAIGHTGRAGTEYHDYFLDLQPAAMAGYSIYIYHVTLEEANQVRAAARLPLLRPGQTEGEPNRGGASGALEWLKKALRPPHQVENTR